MFSLLHFTAALGQQKRASPPWLAERPNGSSCVVWQLAYVEVRPEDHLFYGVIETPVLRFFPTP